MKTKFFLLIIITFSLAQADSHPSEKDRPIKVFFHCGKNAITKMDEEGRGGLGSLLAWVETEKQNHEHKNGRAYLLFPFIDSKDKFLNSFPYDGYQKDKMKAVEIGNVKLGLGYLSSFENSEDLYDMDAWIYFALLPNETKNMTFNFPKDPNLPFFILKEPGIQSSFIFQSNVHEIHCPTEFGKLGVLDLYFRNRDLIRLHHEILSINMHDRNRSWKQKHKSIDESSLPANSPSMKDKLSPRHNSDSPYVGLGNSYDREISGKEKGFDKISVGQAP
jgi:hypothetical protein